MCVCVPVLGSSSINSPTSGGSGGIGSASQSQKCFLCEEEEPERPATNYFVFFFIFILYLPIVCVLLFVSLCLSPGGGLQFFFVRQTTLREHGWQGQQKT